MASGGEQVLQKCHLCSPANCKMITLRTKRVHHRFGLFLVHMIAQLDTCSGGDFQNSMIHGEFGTRCRVTISKQNMTVMNCLVSPCIPTAVCTWHEFKENRSFTRNLVAVAVGMGVSASSAAEPHSEHKANHNGWVTVRDWVQSFHKNQAPMKTRRKFWKTHLTSCGNAMKTNIVNQGHEVT